MSSVRVGPISKFEIFNLWRGMREAAPARMEPGLIGFYRQWKEIAESGPWEPCQEFGDFWSVYADALEEHGYESRAKVARKFAELQDIDPRPTELLNFVLIGWNGDQGGDMEVVNLNADVRVSYWSLSGSVRAR